MNLRVAIVDDERLAREKLKRLLQEIPDSEVVAEAANGADAVVAIEQTRPDVVILDIQMPGMSGFDVLRHLQTTPAVIFSTAFDQFAVRAFEINAVDYLLKPYDGQRLQDALRRVRGKGALNREGREAMEETWRQKNEIRLDKLPVRHGSKIRLIPISEISWFDSEHSMTFAHAGQVKHDVRYTLDELEARLPKEKWFRIHRSTLINRDDVLEIVPWFNGAFKVRLRGCDAEFSVSRHRAKTFRESFHL